MKGILCFMLVFISSFVYAGSNGVTEWYLKDTVRYQNVKVSNIFYAPYEHSPRICAYFVPQSGNSTEELIACATSDNGYFVKNNEGSRAFDQLASMLRYFYYTGENVNVFVMKNKFPDFDSTLSHHELVGIGSCNDGRCLGESI